MSSFTIALQLTPRPDYSQTLSQGVKNLQSKNNYKVSLEMFEVGTRAIMIFRPWINLPQRLQKARSQTAEKWSLSKSIQTVTAEVSTEVGSPLHLPAPMKVTSVLLFLCSMSL